PIGDGNEIANEYGVGHDGVRSWVYTPTVGEGYRRFGWMGIPLVYALLGAIFGFTTGLCWWRRKEREWAALFVFCFVKAPLAWSLTLISAAHYVAWDLPKFLVFFFILRKLQDVMAHLLARASRKTVTATVTIGDISH